MIWPALDPALRYVSRVSSRATRVLPVIPSIPSRAALALAASVALLAALVVSVAPAAALTVSLAEVQGGVAVVEGTEAPAQADIVWEGAVVTRSTNVGAFRFQGAVPADCGGTLSDGMQSIEVAVAKCQPLQRVPKTGQTQCWDGLGRPIPCGGTGQDGDVQAGAGRSYITNRAGTVTEILTGLIWEQHKAADNCGWGTWEAALARIAALNTVKYAGRSDWRLPNAQELYSLVYYGLEYGQPTIDPVFTATPAACYWTSTTHLMPPANYYALTVQFALGLVGTTDKPNTCCSRAVCGGN